MKPFPLDILYDDAARVAGGVDLTPLTNKAVLVTGASGLIGLNLIAALMRSPVRWIMGASRFGLPPFCRPWLDDPRFIDLRFEKQPVQPPPPDFIIHGAGYAQPARASLVAARGIHSSYHYNAIQSWKVGRDGQVTNVQV